MSRGCAVFQHVSFEDLGTLAPDLQNRGYDITVLEPGIDDPTPALDADLLVVLGGPIGVYETDRYPWLATEVEIVRARIARDMPTLGICLGAQIIARAAGMSVYPGEQGKEIGWAPVILTDAGRRSPLRVLDDSPMVLHWHGDTFDIPSGARLLASTERYANQAFTLGRAILGLQFHLEIDPSYTERWLVGHAVELAASGVDVVSLREESARQTRVREIGYRVFSDWMDDLERSRGSDL